MTVNRCNWFVATELQGIIVDAFEEQGDTELQLFGALNGNQEITDL
jgi:hypothetical protein